MHRFGDTPEMATNVQVAPHPGRPRTRDDNDPEVVKHRGYCLAYMQRMRVENRDEYLAKKHEYYERHREANLAYARKRKAMLKEAKMAANSGAAVSVM